MKSAGREVEPWRVPVMALRALERQLSAQPEQFTVALAAEKLLTLLTPDVSAMDVSPLSGLSAVAEKAAAESAPERERAGRARAKAPQPALHPSQSDSTNRFGGVSNVIGAALQRGAAAMGTAAQAGSGIGKAIGGDSGAGSNGRTGVGGIGKALAGSGVALPVDPARRGGGAAASSAPDASVVPIASRQGGTSEKKSPLAAAALAAMEALARAEGDQGPTPEAAAAAKRKDGSALDTGLEAIQRVGELAGKVIEAGAEQLARRQGGFADAIVRGAAAGAGQGAAPDTALGRVNLLATDLLARGTVAGATRGVGEVVAEGTSSAVPALPAAGQDSASRQVSGPQAQLPSTAVAPAARAAAPGVTASAELPDAASITALVNEVLMEQARRQGVDLT